MHSRIHRDLLGEYGVRLNVLGKTSLLPPRVQAVITKAEEMTRHNNRLVQSLQHLTAMLHNGQPCG